MRGDSKSFMTKTLSQKIMKRTRLRNRFLKNLNPENKKSYNKQRHLCASLLREEKRQYFANLNENRITDNTTFWQTVKLFFSNKFKHGEIEKESPLLKNMNWFQRKSLQILS